MGDFFIILKGLSINICFFLALSYLVSLARQYFKSKSKFLKGLINGLIFSVIAGIGMMMHIELMPGRIIDGRIMLVGLAGAYGGLVSGVTATLLVSIFRIFIGGPIILGCIGIIGGGIIGILFGFKNKSQDGSHNTKTLLLLGLVLTLHAQLWVPILLPLDIALKILKQVSIPAFFIYPLGTLLIGNLLNQEIRKHSLYTSLKKSESWLQNSQKRFNLAMDAAQDGLYDWNLVTNEIYYSPGWKRMLGYKNNELPNDFSIWEKLTDQDDVNRSWEMQQELINKKRDRFEIEFRMKHKDGHWVDILSRATALFDNSKKAVRIVGTHVDISKRKQEEERCKQIIELSIDGFWIIDTKGKFLDVNEAYCQIIGYHRDELLKMSIMDIDIAISPSKIREKIERVTKEGSGRFEAKHRHKNGNIIEVEISTSYSENSGGMFYVFLRDITKRKVADKALTHLFDFGSKKGQK